MTYKNITNFKFILQLNQKFNNLKNERSLSHAYEVFNFSYPFTAVSEQNHFVAITMTGGTIMHILNISVEEV